MLTLVLLVLLFEVLLAAVAACPADGAGTVAAAAVVGGVADLECSAGLGGLAGWVWLGAAPGGCGGGPGV